MSARRSFRDAPSNGRSCASALRPANTDQTSRMKSRQSDAIVPGGRAKRRGRNNRIVGEVGVPGIIKKDIAVANVAVDEPRLMPRSQGSTNLVYEAGGALRGPRTMAEPGLCDVTAT